MSNDFGSTSTTPARILFVDHTAELSGGELALLNLVLHLDGRRYEPVVVLFSNGPLAARLEDAGVRTRLLPLPARVVGAKKDGLGWRSLLRVGDVWRIAAHAIRLARLIRRERAALVHTNSLKADVIGGLAARLARRPVVWHVHDRIEAGYLPDCVARVFRRLARWIPTAVIANSASTLATLRLPPHVLATVAPPGLPPESCAEPQRPHDLGSDEPRIGIVGRIAPWKGQHVFLQAAAVVSRSFPRACFFVVGASLFGESACEQELHALVGALGLEGRVEFTGHVEDARRMMSTLDVFVHASTTPEPFGQVITEAMAAGTPVVASDGGGVREIVAHEETGLLAPMGDAGATADAILRLLRDPDAARAMAKRARESVIERFGIGVTVAKATELYDSVLRAAASDRPEVRRDVDRSPRMPGKQPSFAEH